jgi:hypothetical protein
MTRTLPAALALAFVLSACATDPITDLQRQAWATPYERCVGDWEAKFECDCKNRALAIKQQALAQGREVAILVGYRDKWPGVLHMVAVVDGVALDQDGTWPIEQYMQWWTPGPEWYDWRIARDAWRRGQDDVS